MNADDPAPPPAEAPVLDEGRRVPVGCLSLRVHEAGDADAPALVLLHGIGSSGRSFARILPILAREWRVVAWNQPGYGGSDVWPMPVPSASDYGRLALDLMDVLRIERARVVGHSLGALIGAAAAAQAPQRVAALVLADPAAGHGAGPDGLWPESVTDRVAALDRLGGAAYAAERAARLCAPDADPDAIAAVEREMARLTVRGLGAAAAVLACGRIADDLAAYAAGGGAPGLVICGAEDRITPPAGVRAIAEAWRGARYREIPGVGHAGYVEDPAAYAAAVTEPVEARA